MEEYRQSIQCEESDGAGFCQGQICVHVDELKTASRGNLAFKQIEHIIREVLPDICYPVAFLDYVEVYVQHRRRGLASKAVTEFEAFALRKSVSVVFLKASYDCDDDWEQEAEWKQRMYSKLGFIGFSQEHPAFPVMFKRLK